jgi:hypothetical protein
LKSFEKKGMRIVVDAMVCELMEDELETQHITTVFSKTSELFIYLFFLCYGYDSEKLETIR